MSDAAAPLQWGVVRDAFTRRYRVTAPMVLLVSLVPFYIFLPELFPPARRYAPEIAFDRAVPLQPAWALVYGALYGFLIILPLFVVRQEEQIRRTVFAYLTIWITSYVFFIAYPTIAPRPLEVAGDGFFVWSLRTLYGADPPYNCFPSLHVAHSFVSALTIHRVHRGAGILTLIAALLVAVSTLFTKQHYVVDVIAGIVLAFIAYLLFLRKVSRDSVPPEERRAVPALALVAAVIVMLGIGVYRAVYELAP
jgi:membrane-associated phospholipid phosphatase